MILVQPRTASLRELRIAFAKRASTLVLGTCVAAIPGIACTLGWQRSVVIVTLVALVAIPTHLIRKSLRRRKLSVVIGAYDAKGSAASLLRMAQVYRGRGDFDRAEEQVLEALKLSRRRGDRVGVGLSLSGLGAVYQERGQLDQAEASFREALKVFEEEGLKAGTAAVYSTLGVIARERGEPAQARELLQRALGLLAHLDNKEELAKTTAYLGRVHRLLGELEQAEQAYRKELQLYEELGDNRGLAWAYSHLGNAHMDKVAHGPKLGSPKEHELEVAEDAFSNALDLFERLDDKEGIATSCSNRGAAYLERRQFDRAEEALNKALNLFERLGHEAGIATVYAQLGMVHGYRGQLAGTEGAFNKALSLFERLGHKEGIATVYSNLGSLYALIDPEKATAQYRKALQLYAQLGDELRVQEIEEKLTEVWHQKWLN